MKRLTLALTLVLACCLRAHAVAVSTLDVTVRDRSGNPIPNAQVAAISFGEQGPDGTKTRMVTANASGVASFVGVDSLLWDCDYDIFATTQGYAPSINAQFNDPEHLHIHTNSTSTPDQTITLYPAPTASAKIILNITGASANALLFGNVNPFNGANTEPVGFGIGLTDATGAVSLTIFNVPFADANTYNAGAFDPGKNKYGGVNVTQALSASNTSATYALNFNNAIPPKREENRAQQMGLSGDIGLDGVVMDTAAVNAVPHSGVSFIYNPNDPYCQNCTRNMWANTDDNGRFQLFGLVSGTTYYAQIYGNCDWRTGYCYEGSVSTYTALGDAPGINDFLYDGTPITKTFVLNRASGGTGKMAVYVKDSLGNPIPQSMVSVWPDGMGWETSGSCAGHQMRSNPGLANANTQATTGYALIENLPSGNYSVQVWTQFSRSGGTTFNAGANGEPCWNTNSCQCGTDDLRLTIDTTSANNVKIFNSSGTQAGSASNNITVTVALSTQSLNGVVRGTLVFPRVIDLSNDPINITIQPNCGSNSNEPCTGGGYAAISAASTGPIVNYEIHVATGQSYYMNVTSNYWGIVREGGGDNSISLQSTGTVISNMKFAPAGRIIGKLYKPDGTVYQPTTGSQTNSGANINASGDNAWGWAMVNQDGSYSLGGLLPGKYKLMVNGYGAFTYATPQPYPEVSVTVNNDSYQDVTLVKGVALRLQVSTASLARLPSYDCSISKECPPETWTVKALPQGSVLSVDKIRGIVFTGGSAVNQFDYAASTSEAHCPNGPPSSPGFCVGRVPAPTAFDMYLMRRGEMEPAYGIRPFFTILNSTRNVVINDSLATTPYFLNGSSVNVQNVNVTPAVSLAGSGQAVLNGSVAGENIIRQQDFAALGGDFNNFLNYLPIMALYDANNSLKAAGIVMPAPSCLADNQDKVLDRMVAAGDWNGFKNFFDNCAGGWGYEIRGLPPGQTYTAVVTTPNYPPYQTTVTIGTSGSTTTLAAINLDTAVGAGGTLHGVVTSTNSAIIENAAVTVESQAFKKKTLTTDASGYYIIEGLPAGTYTVGVSAADYALAVSKVDVTGTSNVTKNITLNAAGAIITGTVYSQKVPFAKVQPGAQIYAYNDTFNAQNPTSEVPLYKVVTSSTGFYRLDGLEVGAIYKVFLRVPGKYVLNQSTLTVAGTVSGIDFTMLSKPLDIEAFARPTTSYYEFTILNPSDFKTGNIWISSYPFVSTAAATDVTNNFQQLPNNQLFLQYPTSLMLADSDYVLHIEALSYKGQTITKEIVFGLKRKANSAQAIDEILLGDDSEDASGKRGNEAAMDISGENPSALSIPVGAMIPISTGAVPDCRFTYMDTGASQVADKVTAGGSAANFVSGIYQVDVASVNLTDRGFDLTLAYDKTNSQLDDIGLYHYNAGNARWELVPGLQTIDPIRGTITVRRMKGLSNIAGIGTAAHMRAVSNGRTFVPNYFTVQASTDTGSFSIMKPSLVGNAYAGTAIRVFNFPNPFNLQSKTPTLVHSGGTNITTTGTVIKYELPASVHGHVHIRIYTLAGELVRDIDAGEQSGGAYYYTSWDGKNSDGRNVAAGVYYGILAVPGVKAKDATFKMAVVK